ncbi:unnamed protein product [Cuscuta campestris]|uniref:C2H2-type domain-containing protein n=1 Tax=Cuscuta campestris TaxID=132261 RepID=A0A484MIA4_9ASTE|nr:unnamed protein product [Cuscuta campestris]
MRYIFWCKCSMIQFKIPLSFISKQNLSPAFSFSPMLPLPTKPSVVAHRTFGWSIRSVAAEHEIDMVRNKRGVYTAKPKEVVVLWDLDNKPPRGPPYQAAVELKRMAQRFGNVADMSAFANRHAFTHLPRWVIDERRERRRLDNLERRGDLTPHQPYVCSVCGRKCKTNSDLKNHFKQLHERERQKKLNRMASLKGKKRQRYRERFLDNNDKYAEAARRLIAPKQGYGLGSELKRAGVFVRMVADKPQAADLALKQRMRQHSMSRGGVDWVVLVSDDSDFSEMLRGAQEVNLGTVVVGDLDRALGRHADVWVPWLAVEKGEIGEDDLVVVIGKEKNNERLSVGGLSEEVIDFDGFAERRQINSDLNVWEESDDEEYSIFDSEDNESDGDDDDEDDYFSLTL